MKTDDLKTFVLAHKPDWCKTTHVAIVSVLIAAPGSEKDFFLRRCGLNDRAAILRALNILTAVGWVAKSENGLYTAVLDKLPKGDSQ